LYLQLNPHDLVVEYRKVPLLCDGMMGSCRLMGRDVKGNSRDIFDELRRFCSVEREDDSE